MKYQSAITIKDVIGVKKVYKNVKIAGTLNMFCCKVDFKPHNKPNTSFSILRVKFGSTKLIKCLEALLSIEIPNDNLHLNFNYEMATSKSKMANFETQLLLASKH